MFFTQPAAELHSPVPFDLKIKRWAIVERDLETPWFHVCVRVDEGGFYFGRTLLISDIEHLAQMLDELPSIDEIASIMVMTPPKLNGSQLWRLENVIAIDTVIDSTNEKKFHLTTEHGQHELPAPHVRWPARIYGASDTAL